MDESFNNNVTSTSHLLGSVPAVVGEEKNTKNYEVPEASMQTFPPANGGGSSRQGGYQSLGSPTEGFEQQPANNWHGVFSISSYTQYFNVDTDIVVNRILSSLYPGAGDFFSKIDANPDLYGLVWISTTLVFVLASLGNCATYLIEKRSDSTSSWTFNVSYVNTAAGLVYGYASLVPLAYYFLVQYMGGSTASLVRFLCLWGYSLSVFVLSSFLLLIPVEILRWIIILVAAGLSSTFVGLNLRSYLQENDLTILPLSAFFLQMALAIFIKVWFFP